MSDNTLGQRVLEAIHRALPDADAPISLHEPEFSGNEWAYVKDCIDSTFVSSVGEYVDRFEKMLAEFTGVRRAVAVVNGTAGLHAAMVLLGVGRGDEVLLPTLTFVATANAVAYTGAVPHFVDSAAQTLGLDPLKLEQYLLKIAVSGADGCRNRHTGRRIRALIPMHTFGHPVDLDRIQDVCRRFGIALIEDAAEGLGSRYKDHHVGNHGIVSVLSFNGNKIITTGGGGAILTNDEALADQAKHITTTAKLPHQWEYVHDRIGYNYRMPNLNAALGCAQLEQLPMRVARKRALAGRYAAAFENVDGVTFFTEPDFAESNYWLNAILIDAGISGGRDDVLSLTNENGVMTRPVWTLMHQLQMFKDCPRMDLSGAERIACRLINIPSSAAL